MVLSHVPTDVYYLVAMEMEEAGLVLSRLHVPESSISSEEEKSDFLQEKERERDDSPSLHDLDDLEVALEEI